MPEKAPRNAQIIESFYPQVELKISNSADVLSLISLPEYELLSQSKSVIASVGEKKKGYKRWLKMVAFDENYLTAKRKYVFIEDEKPKVLFSNPRAGLRFDCQMVLESELLDEPYADENARRIAILKRVKENSIKDIGQVSGDNEIIGVCGAMISQGLAAALVELESSPAEAKLLSLIDGVEFSTMSLDRGRIKMFFVEDMVSVKMRLGSSF